MAVLVIREAVGGTAENAARLRQELGDPLAVPGAIAFFAGPIDNGWRTISVWESEEAFRAYERETLIPVRERLGRGALVPAQVWPLERVRIAPTAATQTAR